MPYLPPRELLFLKEAMFTIPQNWLQSHPASNKFQYKIIKADTLLLLFYDIIELSILETMRLCFETLHNNTIGITGFMHNI